MVKDAHFFTAENRHLFTEELCKKSNKANADKKLRNVVTVFLQRQISQSKDCYNWLLNMYVNIN